MRRFSRATWRSEDRGPWMRTSRFPWRWTRSTRKELPGTKEKEKEKEKEKMMPRAKEKERRIQKAKEKAKIKDEEDAIRRILRQLRCLRTSKEGMLEARRWSSDNGKIYLRQGT